MVVPIINEDTDNGSLNLSDIHDAPYISQHIPVIPFAKNIYSLYSGNKKLGRLIIDIDTRVINQVLYDFSLPMKGEIFLLDNKNKLLSRSGTYSFNEQAFLDAVTYPFPSMDETISINHEKFLCLTETSALTGWTFCALIPYHMFAQSIIIQMSLTLILFIVCIFAAIIISRPIINSLYKPIGMLISSMKEVENGNLDSFVSYHNQDELLSLIDGYNSMLTQIRNLITQVKTKERSKRQAELYALQAQINPHFLYNTLDTIKWEARIRQVPRIAVLAENLAVILRKSISSKLFIPLKEELETIDSYVEVQEIRFTGRFLCEKEIPDQLEECLVPKMILQPLVENAIIHGLEGCENGYICIYAGREGDVLNISITDNGCGMSPEILAWINSPEPEKRDGHLGLYNIMRILKLYYGNEYGLKAEVTEDGTTVTLSLPVRVEGDDV